VRSVFSPWLFDPVRDATIVEDGEPLQAQRRPCAVAEQELATEAIFRRNRHARVEMESSGFADCWRARETAEI
jgi:hypothetical protein